MSKIQLKNALTQKLNDGCLVILHDFRNASTPFGIRRNMAPLSKEIRTVA